METVKFAGETAWDAIINHHSLDLVEEEAFEAYVTAYGYSKDAKLLELEMLYVAWRDNAREVTP